MTDLRRLGSEDPEAAALFAAARAYRPPARTRRRILRALGVPVGLSLLSSALAHAAQVLAPFKSWIVVGTLAAASAGGGMAYLSQRAVAPERLVVEAPRPAQRIRPRAPATPALVAPVAVVQPPAAPVPVPVRKAPPPSARAARILRQVAQSDAGSQLGPGPGLSSWSSDAPPGSSLDQDKRPGPRPSGAPLEPPSFSQLVPPPAPAPRVLPRSTLGQELALIEKARGELEQASPRRALITLDEYARSFPGGALLEEAELLRLSALKASGARLEAAAAAETFLMAHPRSPLAARARSFLPVDPSK
jgi:hypothetical protein